MDERPYVLLFSGRDDRDKNKKPQNVGNSIKYITKVPKNRESKFN